MKNFLLSISLLVSLLLVSSCNGGKNNQLQIEQDSIFAASQKAYKELLFGMSINEVKKLGYLESDEPILNVNLEDIDENGDVIFKEDVNGVVNYGCKSKNIGEYTFSFASLGFANDSLVEVTFQKNVEFKSSLSVVYKEIKDILDSNYGNPFSENLPDFTIPSDMQVLEYHVGSKHITLSFDVDEDAVAMGFDNKYCYILEIIDSNKYSKAKTDSKKTTDI